MRNILATRPILPLRRKNEVKIRRLFERRPVFRRSRIFRRPDLRVHRPVRRDIRLSRPRERVRDERISTAATDYDLLGFVPAGTPRETAIARQGVVTLVRPDELVEEVYVTDRQLERVDLRQSLLVR